MPVWVPPFKEWGVQQFFSHLALLQALTVLQSLFIYLKT